MQGKTADLIILLDRRVLRSFTSMSGNSARRLIRESCSVMPPWSVGLSKSNPIHVG